MERAFNHLQAFMKSAESSKWLIGAATILVPILSKTERLKIGTAQRQILENEFMDLLFVFTIVFSGTRDLAVSLALTFVSHFILNHVFSVGTPFSLLEPDRTSAPIGEVSNKDIGDALDTLERAYHERQGPERAPWLL